MLLALNIEVLGVVVFVLTAIGLGYTIYLFVQSRRSMQQLMRQNNFSDEPPLFDEPAEDFSPFVYTQPKKESSFSFTKKEPAVQEVKTTARRDELSPENRLSLLKNTISNQKGILDSLAQKVSELEYNSGSHLQNENDELKEEIEKLQWQLSKKESEAQKLRQQDEVARQMAKRLDEVHKDFEGLQSKMAELEKSAAQAADLRMLLDDERQGVLAMRKEMQHKAEKMDRLLAENAELMQRLSEAEDKLAEANLQRQQQHKKIAYLEELNNDFQQIAETNKKMQTELRRIGELESMLNMISEERDYLLRKRMQ